MVLAEEEAISVLAEAEEVISVLVLEVAVVSIVAHLDTLVCITALILEDHIFTLQFTYVDLLEEL